MIKVKSEKLKEYMKKEKYTRKSFSNLVGITERELNKILSGYMDFKFISLVLIARFLEIPVEWLLDSGVPEVQTKFYL